MVDHVASHRPEQHLLESALSPATDHQQVGVRRSFDQRLGWMPVHWGVDHREIVAIGTDRLTHGLVQEPVGLDLERRRIERRAFEARDGVEVPGMNHFDRVPIPGLADRPFQSGSGRFGCIDTDNDRSCRTFFHDSILPRPLPGQQGPMVTLIGMR